MTNTPSYETVRRWVLKFGPLFARELRHQRPRPTSTWHLDEMAVVIGGSVQVPPRERSSRRHDEWPKIDRSDHPAAGS
jgi:hypothetical protein